MNIIVYDPALRRIQGIAEGAVLRRANNATKQLIAELAEQPDSEVSSFVAEYIRRALSRGWVDLEALEEGQEVELYRAIGRVSVRSLGDMVFEFTHTTGSGDIRRFRWFAGSKRMPEDWHTPEQLINDAFAWVLRTRVQDYLKALQRLEVGERGKPLVQAAAELAATGEWLAAADVIDALWRQRYHFGCIYEPWQGRLARKYAALATG